ncbi:ATP-binding domain-containing protein [Pediococcus acidilactici]
MVILPMVRQYYRMLQRNLLYTGLTRASDSIILLGEVEAYQRAVQNESANRQTGLVKRLNPEIAITEKPIAEKSEPKTTSEKSEAGEPQRKSILTKPEVTETFATSGDEPTLLTKQLVETGKIDPMIGMDGVTPGIFFKYLLKLITKDGYNSGR